MARMETRAMRLSPTPSRLRPDCGARGADCLNRPGMASVALGR